MEKPPAQGSPTDETTSDDLLRLADRLIDLSRRERERIAASMANPSDDWLEATARFAEIARQASEKADSEAAGLTVEEDVPGELTTLVLRESG